jgi:hypothetical protein
MKLTFFLIAFFLILLRVYYSWAGYAHRRDDDGNIITRSDNYIEEIHWSGKVKLSDDEKSIASISPGGYLKFRENDQKLVAESNLQGEISYTLFDGQKSLTLNDSGQRFVAGVLQKMVRFGFCADGRPERIYKKGGNRAVLDELTGNPYMDNVSAPYMDLLFKGDSLTMDETMEVMQLIEKTGNDDEKIRLLEKFTTKQLKDSVIGLAWLSAAGRVWPEHYKRELVDHYMKLDSTGGGAAAGWVFAGARYDSLLKVIGQFEGMERSDLYKQLLDHGVGTDEAWISLIRSVAQQNEVFRKSDLLVEIAGKMPKNEKVKTEFLAAAKSITDDREYGQVMRAVE